MERIEIKKLVLNYLKNQITNINSQIVALAQDAQNDAKSSAGDKHETALSMMHLEQEKLNLKLAELLKMQQSAQQLAENKLSEHVVLGSIVHTNSAIFYVSVPIQPIIFNDLKIICVSIHAPLIQQFLNKTVGNVINFNNVSYKIEAIY